jgi:hypothetical protein
MILMDGFQRPNLYKIKIVLIVHFPENGCKNMKMVGRGLF